VCKEGSCVSVGGMAWRGVAWRGVAKAFRLRLLLLLVLLLQICFWVFSSSSNMSYYKIFFGQLAFETTREALWSVVSGYADVRSVHFPPLKRSKSGKMLPTGTAYVEVATHEQALAVISALHESQVFAHQGKPIQVELAHRSPAAPLLSAQHSGMNASVDRSAPILGHMTGSAAPLSSAYSSYEDLTLSAPSSYEDLSAYAYGDASAMTAASQGTSSKAHVTTHDPYATAESQVPAASYDPSQYYMYSTGSVSAGYGYSAGYEHGYGYGYEAYGAGAYGAPHGVADGNAFLSA
jgi:RNA recognition motif. (a.k.a. RRM, RBD, or RNP domain)